MHRLTTFNNEPTRHQRMVVSSCASVLSICNKKKHLVTDLLCFVCSNLPDATVNQQVTVYTARLHIGLQLCRINEKPYIGFGLALLIKGQSMFEL